MGLKGSKYLAERFKSENLNLYAMVNFEMLGVPFLDNRAYDVFISGYDLSNMAGKMNDYIGKNVVGRSEEAVKYNLFRASDNYPFYEAFKLPCQTISSCDLTNYKYYHHVDDEADQLDYKHMANVVNKMILAIEGISNSATKEIKMNDE
jgi:Zn-dependent M28 family amino/carboxypeptidase